MGYTHYWTQTRDFTVKEWEQIGKDMDALFEHVSIVQSIPLAGAQGEPDTNPIVNDDKIWFNGSGDGSHETFCLNRISKGRDFCKTAQKPYDLAVTAALCYLQSVTKSHEVSSDGEESDWTKGLEEARKVWPQHAAVLAIPHSVIHPE